MYEDLRKSTLPEGTLATVEQTGKAYVKGTNGWNEYLQTAEPTTVKQGIENYPYTQLSKFSELVPRLAVRYKETSVDAKAPSYAREGDAGLDLTACTEAVLGVTELYGPQPYIEYETGIALEIPEGYVGLIFPRSSISKYDLALCNSVGVIDSKFRGNIRFRFRLTTDLDRAKIYNKGDKIGQLIIMPYPTVELFKVDQLEETERGEGSFGSSGT